MKALPRGFECAGWGKRRGKAASIDTAEGGLGRSSAGLAPILVQLGDCRRNPLLSLGRSASLLPHPQRRNERLLRDADRAVLPHAGARVAKLPRSFASLRASPPSALREKADQPSSPIRSAAMNASCGI
jgi:hypothetical protein